MKEDDDYKDNTEIDGGLKELMKNYDLDEDTAERVVEIMDEYGVDEDEAVEIQEAE